MYKRLSHKPTVARKQGPSAARALNFASDSRPRTSSSSSTNFYGSRSRHQDNDFQWQPGQTLPLPSRLDSHLHTSDQDINHDRSHTPSEMANIVELLHTFQNSMDSKLQSISDKLTDVDDRLVMVESRQESLENEVKSMSAVASASQSPAFTDTDKRRRRLTPVALQNRIRTVHNSFEPDLHFKIEEPITSTHNTKVVTKIEEALHDQHFSPHLIQQGCRTYKKTIAAREKQMSTPVKKRKLARSLKQRAYERRSRMVKEGKEKTYWNDVTADMMSDEERIDDKYVCHAPSYRSQKLSKFLQKLDDRALKKGNSHARFERERGSPWKKDIPPNTKRWIVNEMQEANTLATADEEQNSELELSAESEAESDSDSTEY